MPTTRARARAREDALRHGAPTRGSPAWAGRGTEDPRPWDDSLFLHATPAALRAPRARPTGPQAAHGALSASCSGASRPEGPQASSPGPPLAPATHRAPKRMLRCASRASGTASSGTRGSGRFGRPKPRRPGRARPGDVWRPPRGAAKRYAVSTSGMPLANSRSGAVCRSRATCRGRAPKHRASHRLASHRRRAPSKGGEAMRCGPANSSGEKRKAGTGPPAGMRPGGRRASRAGTGLHAGSMAPATRPSAFPPRNAPLRSRWYAPCDAGMRKGRSPGPAAAGRLGKGRSTGACRPSRARARALDGEPPRSRPVAPRPPGRHARPSAQSVFEREAPSNERLGPGPKTRRARFASLSLSRLRGPLLGPKRRREVGGAQQRRGPTDASREATRARRGRRFGAPDPRMPGPQPRPLSARARPQRPGLANAHARLPPWGPPLALDRPPTSTDLRPRPTSDLDRPRPTSDLDRDPCGPCAGAMRHPPNWWGGFVGPPRPMPSAHLGGPGPTRACPRTHVARSARGGADPGDLPTLAGGGEGALWEPAQASSRGAKRRFEGLACAPCAWRLPKGAEPRELSMASGYGIGRLPQGYGAPRLGVPGFGGSGGRTAL